MRSAFAAAVCTGVTMVGVSVHGLMGVDADLQRSVMAAQRQHQVRPVSFSVSWRERPAGCPALPAPRTRERV